MTKILKRIVSKTRSAALSRALLAVAYVLAGLWLVAIVLALSAFVLVNQPDTRGFVWALIPAILAASVGASFLSEWGDLYGQRARDIQAQAIFEAVRANTPTRPFTLYLRPFASTDVISETDYSGGLGVTGGIGFVPLAGEKIELEAQIERAVRPLGQLIALGAPLEHFGAGRVLVDENAWLDAIKTLMDRAHLIVMLPSSRPGTLKEIGMVLESDLVRKTVFLDPPNLGSHKRYDQGREWEAVREAFQSRGYNLPEETRRGLLMFFGEDKKAPLKEWLEINAEDRIERLFAKVLKSVRHA